MSEDNRFQGYFPGPAKHGHQGCWNGENGFVQCDGCGNEFLDCRDMRNRLGLVIRYRPAAIIEQNPKESDLSICPKCGNSLYVEDVEQEISYVRVLLACEGTVQDTGYPGTKRDATCNFREIREIDVGDIREHGMLKEDEDL